MFGIRESKDLLAMIDDTYKRFGDDIFLGLHGESMGSGLSLMALQYKPKVKFLVADCGYGRLLEVLCGKVKEIFHLPGFFAYPASWVCRILYQRMHKINKGYSELHTFPKADHAQSLDSDVERYEDILRDFVAKVL